MARKSIKKMSVVELPPAVGSISDTLNVEDKIKNAPSINLVQRISGVPVDGIIAIDKSEETPEGWEEVDGKSFITTGLSANYTATSTNQIILPMKNVFSKYGNAFTVQSDGTILMNKDMYIRIHAQIFFSAATAGSKSLILRLNSDTEISYSVNENVQQYSIIPTHTGIISVKKGDVVKLTAYLFANEIINAMQKNTFMTIEEMEEPRNIQRKSVVKVDKITGSIVDSENINDKTSNTYSANIIDSLLENAGGGGQEIDFSEILNKIAPVGSGMDYYGSSAPTNYMFANGAAISRTEYAELFAVIGTTYGAGDGSTTFNLPDKRSRVSVMMNSSDGNFNSLGKKIGQASTTLVAANLPKQTGGFTFHGAATGSVVHTVSGVFSTSSAIGNTYKNGGSQVMGANSYTTINFNNSGSSTAFTNIQQSFVCNYIIRVK